MSTLQDLKQKELTAAENFNKLNDDLNYQSLRSRVQEQVGEYQRLNAESIGAEKAGNTEESARLRLEANAALSAFTELNKEFKPLRQELETYKAEYETARVQVLELNTTSTQPAQNQKTQFEEQTAAATKQASETPTPVPPPQEQNLPTAEDDPLGYAAPNEQVPFVFNQDQLGFIERYNKSVVESGNPDLQVEANSTEALDVLIAGGQILPPDEIAVQQQTVNDEPPRSVTIGGVFPQSEEFQDESEEFQDETAVPQQTVNGDPAIDSQVVETFEEGDPAVDSQVVETFEEGDPAVDSQFTEEFPTQIQPMINTAREQTVGKAAPDIRFRIKLADRADYFYNADRPGIMAPLRATNGVIFPYTPLVTVSYVANYTPLDAVHTNYKFYSYKNSSVENINITGDFTAQNTVEANYLLAVIHFFRSATKMFYGQDQNPSRGVPPPLMYISGYGPYQFDNHPVVITNFTYNLPQDVDYIDAYPTNNTNALGGLNLAPYTPTAARFTSPLDRLRSLVSSGIAKGGLPPPPNFQNSQNINESTRVPTKINIQITCLPIATRNAVSNKFSLKEYANGSLLRGSVNPGTGGGFW